MVSNKNTNAAKILPIHNNDDNFIKPSDEQLESAFSKGQLTGLEDSKDIVMKLIAQESNGGLGKSNLYDIFGTDNCIEILNEYSMSDIRLLIKVFMDNKSTKPNIDMEIGDEVEFIQFGHMRRGILTKVNKEGIYLYLNVLCSDGSCVVYRYDTTKIHSVGITGRKFKGINEILDTLSRIK